ncbi:M28 family peptidase [Chitinimonas sp. BJYL2]|uniref:M28 family peptidase n=1 Tax=Chitinimonas sp. BJYL2 TaxID=2976696 RepID=UPI0022B3B178|nr:M28 family peptidase [Chitinimonas sp. BJYL2]
MHRQYFHIASLLAAIAAPGVAHAQDALIRSDQLIAHTRILSSAEFEGRGVASAGEQKTVAYLTEQYKAMGLAPGNPDGSYVQKVPMVGIQTQPSLRFSGCAKDIKLDAPIDYVAFTTQEKPRIRTQESDLVFVGYGVVAPEYGWDDYKNVDVRGKTIVMLINDPQLPDPHDPARLDDSKFKGRAMTYYGRWMYKYEMAARKGAAAAIIIHETIPAAYPWLVVLNSNSRENFTIAAKDGHASDVPVRSWLRGDHAEKLLKACGQDFDQLKQAALSPGFKPVKLKAKASFTLNNTLRRMDSHNVVARLEGSDPARRDELIVYTSHWDHLGKRGNDIYYGATDNATGSAALLELGRAFSDAAKAGHRPARSLLFLATTAEESGLLGAAYYAANPLYPLARTVANINIDGINTWGRTRDMVIVGAGQSSLENIARDAVAQQGRVVAPEAKPENGGYFRSDHFEFAKAGIPALYMWSGVDYIGKPTGYGIGKMSEYISNDYHKPSDVMKPDWDLSGGVEDTELLYRIGRRLADGVEQPAFNADSEFRAKQHALQGKAGQRYGNTGYGAN